MMNPTSYIWTSMSLQSQSAMVSNVVIAGKMKQYQEEIP